MSSQLNLKSIDNEFAVDIRATQSLTTEPAEQAPTPCRQLPQKIDPAPVRNSHDDGVSDDHESAPYKERKLSIINCDQHINGTYETLYGVVIPNDNYKIQQDKWLSKLRSPDGLRESLLRAKNANKYNEHNGYDDTECKVSEEEKQSTQGNIEEFIDENQDDQMEAGDVWLNQIINDVIKPSDLLDFRMNSIGAKRNIYINEQFTKTWTNFATPTFADESMMYCWLDNTTAMQMSQSYCKQYVNKQNRNKDDSTRSDDAWLKADNAWLNQMDGDHLLVCGFIRKYSRCIYKVLVVMITYRYKLTLKRSITKQDLDAINWYNLMKSFQSQSSNHHKMRELMTITHEGMKQFCCRALKRLNNNNLIPIVVVDKNERNYYKIEFVLIDPVIHDIDNDDIGVSFRYNPQTNVFIPSSIYLDKRDIQSKHTLTGLKLDFKFKNDEHVLPSEALL